ncbi:MAG: hypothetical protein HY332_06000 [Chloroflexi bacterium]|nr:hypothetical protein [Chloroflexota bacterium]
MPLDDDLPPSRLPSHVPARQVVEHFPGAFGIRVHVDDLNALPTLERQSLSGARLPEPPEAVLLDRVLQLVPLELLQAVERIVILQTRGTARQGGSRSRAIRLSAQEARVREGDPRYGRAFSLFTTTVLHEIGHVVFAEVLTETQREQVYADYMDDLERLPVLPASEPSQAGLEHYFIRYFIAALLGRGERPVRAGDARRRMAALGLDLRGV